MATASWLLPQLYHSDSTGEVLETLAQSRQQSFSNFVHLPHVDGAEQQTQQESRRAKPGRQKNRTHHPSRAQTDRGSSHHAHSHSLPVLRAPPPVAAVPHTSRVAHVAAAARSKPAASTTALVPSALDSAAMFTPAPRSAWALGSASLAALASAGALNAAASVGGDRGEGAIALSTTHGAQRRKFSSDAARAEAWKAAARLADQQSKGHGSAEQSKSRAKRSERHNEEKRSYHDPYTHSLELDAAGGSSDDEDFHNPESHSREVMHILRPASRPSEPQTGEAGVGSGSLAVPGGLGGSSGKLGTPRSRRGSVSLKSLLGASDPGGGGGAAAAAAHATSTARRRDSLIEGLLASGAGIGNLATHSRRPSATGSGGNSGRNSGRTTPRGFSNRRGSRDIRGGGEQKAGSKGSSGTATPSGSGLAGSTSSASLGGGGGGGGRHHLAPVDDDPSSESRAVETSAYYSIIQSATRRLAEQLENLDPSEEMLLRKEWTERGMTEEEIANRLRRRGVAPILQYSQPQQQQTTTTATGARSTASLPAFSISLSPSAPSLGGGVNNTDSPHSTSRFLLGGSSSAASLQQQQPSNYDRYRASFSTVRALIESMARSSSGTAADGSSSGHAGHSATSKEALFQSVSRFFSERSKLDASESRKLDALLNENSEVEAGVESTARFLGRAIKLKEVHDIKLLNGYYSSLRNLHLKHQGSKQGGGGAAAKRHGGAGSSTALPTLTEDAVDFLALGAIIAGDFAPDSEAGGNANPAAELFERMDAVGLALHASPAPNAASPPITGRFLPKPLADGSATLLRASQNTAPSISASEAMESLQQKLADVPPGGEAHALKMELLISMLTAKLGEQNRVISKHPPLAARRREFESKASHVLQTVAATQAALKAEERRLQDLEDQRREASGRLQHVVQFESREKLMASVSAEQQAQAKQKEDAEDAALLRMHQDRAIMEEHLAEVERASGELATRLKRLDGELAHLQRARESDRMKSKLLEKQLKKEVSLVLNGHIPPPLAKELAQEQELINRDRRAEERLENSEPVRMDFSLGSNAASNNAAAPAAVAGSSPVTDSSTSPTKESKDATASALASPHNDDDDDDDSDRSGSEHSDAHSRIGSAAQKSVARNRSRQNSIFNGSSPVVKSGSRPTSVAATHARSHSRWGAPGSRVHRRAPSSFSLGMAPGEDPEALVSIRAGVAELSKIKAQLAQELEAEVAALLALGIPAEDPSASGDRTRRKRSMEGVKEGEEAAAEEGSPEHQNPSSNHPSDESDEKRAAKRKSLEAGESLLSPSASDKKLGARGNKDKGVPGRSPLASSRRAGANVSNKDKASAKSTGEAAKSGDSKGLANSKSDRKLGTTGAKKPGAKKTSATAAATAEGVKKEKRKSNKKGEAVSAPNAAAPATDAAAISPEPTPRQIAADSMRRRRSFENRYSNLLSFPDPSAVPATIPADPDDEVVLDFDAQGKINGAFTRREVRAQTARFRAQIQALANEHRAMSQEMGKLAAVGPKLTQAQHMEQVAAATYANLEAELADLMSRHRAAQIAAEAHGLVVGSDPADLTADDIAEHAIWVEDGFTGEAHVPGLENEEWTVEWQAEEDARVKREQEAEKARTAKMKEEAAALEKQKSLVASSSDPAAASSTVTSPVTSPRSSTQALRQSAAEAVAAALIAKEDAEDEADETRMARDTWEDALRERFESAAAASGEYAPKVARFTAKIGKLQNQLDSLRITTGTEAELLREKIAMLHSKSQALLAAKEAALQAQITQAEPSWQAEWNAGKDERQERRSAARAEAVRAEAAANKAEAARLKREKRQAANAGNVAANSARKSANLSLRRSTSMASPRGSRNALFGANVRSQLKQSGGSGTGSSADNSPVKFSKQMSLASAPASIVSIVLPSANPLFVKAAPTVVADINEEDETAETASVISRATTVAPMPVVENNATSAADSAENTSADASETTRRSEAAAAAARALISPALLPLHTEHTRLQSTKDSLAQRIEEVRRAIESKKSGGDAAVAARRQANRASQSVMLQQAIESALKEAEQWKLIAQGVPVADPPTARATAAALTSTVPSVAPSKQASDSSSVSPPKLAMHVSLQHASSPVTAEHSLQASPIVMQSDSAEFPSSPHTGALSLDEIGAEEPREHAVADPNDVGAWGDHSDSASASTISEVPTSLALASETSRFLGEIAAPVVHTPLRTQLTIKHSQHAPTVQSSSSHAHPSLATPFTPAAASAAVAAAAPATLDHLDIPPEPALRRSSLVAAEAAAAARERWARRQLEIIAEQQRTMAALAARQVNTPSYAAVATTELERAELMIDLTTAPASTKVSPAVKTSLSSSSSHAQLRGQPSAAAAGQRRPSAMLVFVPPKAAAESYIVSSNPAASPGPAAPSSKARLASSNSSQSLHSSPGSSASSSSVSLLAGSGAVYGPAANLGGANQPHVTSSKVNSSGGSSSVGGTGTHAAHSPAPVLRTLNMSAMLMQPTVVAGRAAVPSLSPSALLDSSASDSHASSAASLQSFLEPVSAAPHLAVRSKDGKAASKHHASSASPTSSPPSDVNSLITHLLQAQLANSESTDSLTHTGPLQAGNKRH